MRGTTGLKITGLGVLAALAAAPQAHAALAGGQFMFTENRPDLVSATINENTDSSYPKAVNFCFDVTLSNDEVDNNHFWVAGYDSSSQAQSDLAFFDPENPKCVIALFDDDTQFEEHTVATIQDGAVQNLNGQENLLNAAPLDSATNPNGSEDESNPRVGGGLTTAPDLVGAVKILASNTIRLTFDAKVDDDTVDPDRILYYEPNGNRVFADSAVVSDGDKRIVFVQFPKEDDQSVADAVRVALEDGAVRLDNQENERSVRQSLAVFGQDGYTARPDLLAVTPRPEKNAVDYCFDAKVAVEDEEQFEVFREEERRFVADHAQVLAISDCGVGTSIVRAFFNDDAMSIIDELSVASVDNGAVEATTGDREGNSIGSKPLGSIRGVTGFTSAPDAQEMLVDLDDGTITLVFDQPAEVLNLNRISVIDRMGQEFNPAPDDVAQDGGNRVILNVGSGLSQQAVAVTLGEAAVEHADAGDDNVRQAIGRVDAVYSPGTGPFPGDLGGTDPGPKPPSNGGGGGGGGQGTPAPAPAPQVAGAGGQAPVARVSPARSGRSAKARVLYAKYRKGKLTLKVSGKAKKVKIRIALRNRKGKTVKSVTRTIKTNRRVTLKNLTRSSSVKSVKIRVL